MGTWVKRTDASGKVLRRCYECRKATLFLVENGEEVREKCERCGWVHDLLFDGSW